MSLNPGFGDGSHCLNFDKFPDTVPVVNCSWKAHGGTGMIEGFFGVWNFRFWDF